MKFLSDAIGSYVAWPTHLVALQKKIPKDKSVTSPEKVQINKPPLQPKKGSKPQKLEVNRAAKLQRLEGNKAAKLAATKNLDRGKSVAAAAAPNKSQPRLGKYGACLDIQIKRNMGSSNDSPIVQMNKDIFGDEYIEYLEKEQMYELLEHKELSATVISLYIRFLYEKVVCTRKLSNKYSFLSPHKMSMFKLDPDNVKHYIVDMFLRNKESDKLFLAPYNSGKFLKSKLVNGRYGCVEADWWKKVAVDLYLREEVETVTNLYSYCHPSTFSNLLLDCGSQLLILLLKQK
ncbi:uncharacterized protein [Cicer arietinum]|uniref:uncharacterized protein n=1 Tax=Cicer arietinum TaxID=3827 RepID=UPI003CC66D08